MFESISKFFSSTPVQRPQALPFESYVHRDPETGKIESRLIPYDGLVKHEYSGWKRQKVKHWDVKKLL